MKKQKSQSRPNGSSAPTNTGIDAVIVAATAIAAGAKTVSAATTAAASYAAIAASLVATALATTAAKPAEAAPKAAAALRWTRSAAKKGTAIVAGGQRRDSYEQIPACQL